MNNDSPPPPPSDASPFGNVIYAYTRKQALADGVQVDVTAMAKKAGFRIPVFITDTVYNEYVKVPLDVEAQDEKGRLWDILCALERAIKRVPFGIHEVHFHCYVCNSMTEPANPVQLFAVCSALDIDDPASSITIMLPIED